jgi:hypothetical protein
MAWKSLKHLNKVLSLLRIYLYFDFINHFEFPLSPLYYEVGNAQHHFHIHGMLKLQHTGNYKLSNKKIRGVVENILGKKVHFNAMGSADVERVWA